MSHGALARPFGVQDVLPGGRFCSGGWSACEATLRAAGLGLAWLGDLAAAGSRGSIVAPVDGHPAAKPTLIRRDARPSRAVRARSDDLFVFKGLAMRQMGHSDNVNSDSSDNALISFANHALRPLIIDQPVSCFACSHGALKTRNMTFAHRVGGGRFAARWDCLDWRHVEATDEGRVDHAAGAAAIGERQSYAV